ncbi:unnamed protein product [Peniophora sp. CBMAI 1063]|nr:unnamed protein product [Peniophora sp. CBMAI 1063]
MVLATTTAPRLNRPSLRRQPTATEFEPGSDPFGGVLRSPTTTSPSRRSPSHTASSPGSPLLGRRRRSVTDDSGDSPRKRIRILASSLSRTRASFLISKKPAHSSEQLAPSIHEAVQPEPLPEPDWSLLKHRGRTTEELMDLPREVTAQLLRDSLSALELSKAHQAARNEALQKANSCVVLQRLENTRMRKALAAKEKKKDAKRLTKRALICPKGQPSHLTNPQLIEALEKMEAEKEQEELDAKQRKKDAELKSTFKRQQEEYWVAVKTQVGREQAEWDKRLSELRAEGETVKNAKEALGKKPAMPLKADVLAEFSSRNLRPLVDPPSSEVEAEHYQDGEEWQGFGWRLDHSRDGGEADDEDEEE